MYRASIMSWINVYARMRNGFVDMSFVALALLAKHRYNSISAPLAYKNSLKLPTYRLLAPMVIVVIANSMSLTSDVLFDQQPPSPSATWITMEWVALACGESLRSTYLFVNLYM